MATFCVGYAPRADKREKFSPDSQSVKWNTFGKLKSSLPACKVFPIFRISLQHRPSCIKQRHESSLEKHSFVPVHRRRVHIYTIPRHGLSKRPDRDSRRKRHRTAFMATCWDHCASPIRGRSSVHRKNGVPVGTRPTRHLVGHGEPARMPRLCERSPKARGYTPRKAQRPSKTSSTIPHISFVEGGRRWSVGFPRSRCRNRRRFCVQENLSHRTLE